MKHNIYSNTKIFGHPQKIAAFRDGRITAPIYVRVKPINRCSHACHWCVYSDGHTRPKDRPEQHLISGMHETMKESDVMPTPKAFELFDDLYEMGTRAVTFSGGGEPLMHPRIAEIMEYARDDAELDISIITNGQSLSGARAAVLAHAKWVRISMDYWDGASMAASRNVPEDFFDRILANIHDFSKAKRPDCDLGVNFIVTRENHSHLVPIAIKLRDLGVENIRFSPVYLQGFGEYHRPIHMAVEGQLEAIQRYCDNRFTVNSSYDIDSPSKVPIRPFKRCLYMQTVPVVGADLGVYACHNTAYSDHGRIGSIEHQSFRELWFSAAAREIFQKFDPSSVCNHECANHAKVELFNTLANAPTDNFV